MGAFVVRSESTFVFIHISSPIIAGKSSRADRMLELAQTFNRSLDRPGYDHLLEAQRLAMMASSSSSRSKACRSSPDPPSALPSVPSSVRDSHPDGKALLNPSRA
jgi:hypothetical protein